MDGEARGTAPLSGSRVEGTVTFASFGSAASGRMLAGRTGYSAAPSVMVWQCSIEFSANNSSGEAVRRAGSTTREQESEAFWRTSVTGRFDKRPGSDSGVGGEHSE
jgi:hypothetical protein